jgi:hypothetical protein
MSWEDQAIWEDVGSAVVSWHESRNRIHEVPDWVSKHLPIDIKGVLSGVLLLIIFGVLAVTCKELSHNNLPQGEQMEEQPWCGVGCNHRLRHGTVKSANPFRVVTDIYFLIRGK